MPSLALQVFIYFNIYYIPLYFFLTLVMLVYKGIMYPYPPTAYSLEVISLLAFFGVEASRMFLGTKGNKTDQTASVVCFLGLALASLFGFLFFLLWQTFVLLFDVILNALGLGFILLETIFAAIHLVDLVRE